METIKEITSLLAEISDLCDTRFEQFSTDSRLGVQKAVIKRKKEIQAENDEKKRLEAMLRYEQALYQKGVTLIAGVDEVGRGPLAGPVVAAAVILPRNCQIKGLNDSKKIPKKKHQTIYNQVMKEAVAIGVGVKDQTIIDQVNIYEATKLAMLDAILQLNPQPQALLIDAMQLDIPMSQQSIIKGDANSLSIAAASIVAKVTRDRMMTEFDKKYPGYGFAQNAGYGTQMHLAGLKKFGISPIHRQTFEPVKSMLKKF